MNLKLAEYKDGKFERFLELGRILGYNGESDNLFSYAGNSISIMDTVCVYCEKEEVVYATIETREFFKDEKDPLNRFDGLFDGRTYGKGRFVLIEIVNDYPDYEFFKSGEDFYISHYGIAHKRFDKGGLLWRADYDELDNPDMVKVGNIFQNPKLWEKIK